MSETIFPLHDPMCFWYPLLDDAASDTSVSTSGCSSLVPHVDKADHREKLSKFNLDRLSGQLRISFIEWAIRAGAQGFFSRFFIWGRKYFSSRRSPLRTPEDGGGGNGELGKNFHWSQKNHLERKLGIAREKTWGQLQCSILAKKVTCTCACNFKMLHAHDLGCMHTWCRWWITAQNVGLCCTLQCTPLP